MRLLCSFQTEICGSEGRKNQLRWSLTTPTKSQGGVEKADEYYQLKLTLRGLWFLSTRKEVPGGQQWPPGKTEY